MRALHSSCLLPSPVCICKGVEDGLCSAQQAGTLNVSKSPLWFSFALVVISEPLVAIKENVKSPIALFPMQSVHVR